MIKIDCLEFIEKLRSKYDLTKAANLVVFNVGHNSASELYIKSKCAEAAKWNINVDVRQLDESVTTDELKEMILKANIDNNVHGIIVQLPLPKHIDQETVLNSIRDIKNVDGFKQANKPTLFTPCTPLGIMTLLNDLTLLEGKMVTLLGRGRTVGEPLRDLLINANATVAICHSKTTEEDRDSLLGLSDIVISAVGIPNLFSQTDLNPRTIVIDAGISRVDGKQVGDFSHKGIDTRDDIRYTGWTGGVGKLTVAALMINTRKAMEKFCNEI